MDRRTLAALVLAGIVGAGALTIDGPMPPHVPGEQRMTTLNPCASDWSAWAQAWCPDGDAACIDANDDPQGIPMCVNGVPVGQCASTPATFSQEARALHLGVAIDTPPGWEACPDAAP
jgi:hypothetical protein